MKYVLALSAALLLAVGQPQAAHAQHKELIAQAVAAQGGAGALRALKLVWLKADAAHWDVGQTMVPGGEPRFLGNSTIEMVWDLANGQARSTWDRDKKYPFPRRDRFTEVVLPTLGYEINDRGESRAMSGIRVATALRELERISPILMLQAMEAKSGVRPLANELLNKRAMLAIGYQRGGTNFIILLDPATKLPAAIRTREDDNIDGDSNFDVLFGDWRTIGGAKVAHALSYQWNGVEIGKVTYKEFIANPAIGSGLFAVPDGVKAAAKPPATNGVPYSWVVKRLLLGTFLDSDAIIHPAGGGLKLVELAPNVQHVQGGTANNLIVAMKDHLVIVDAPYGDLQSRWVIDAAKARYPGKPVRYLVMTHHHMDHAGGARAFIAEGAAVIVPAPGKAYFEMLARRPHTIVPDELQMKPRPAKVEDVADERILKDESGEIRLYNVDNPHVKGMLMVHLPQPNIVYVTDILSIRPPFDRTPGTVAVGAALRKYGINDAMIAAGHGTNRKQSELGAQIGQEVGSR
jgi:glyoxylase-like metal-dependent hydrolase (beta-lactamase superfamily II)